MSPKRRVSVDGFARRPAQQLLPRQQSGLRNTAAQPRAIAPASAPTKPRARSFAPPAPPPRRAGVWQRLQLPLTIVIGLIVGFFMQSLLFGLGLIALYGVLALVFKVQSRVTFVLAFLSLLAVILLLLVKRNPEQSGNFATYTFLLLMVAVVSLMIELRQAKPHYKKR